jgi:hypothetical protein
VYVGNLILDTSLDSDEEPVNESTSGERRIGDAATVTGDGAADATLRPAKTLSAMVAPMRMIDTED